MYLSKQLYGISIRNKKLIEIKNKTIIKYQELNGGVAQLVRAQDS